MNTTVSTSFWTRDGRVVLVLEYSVLVRSTRTCTSYNCTECPSASIRIHVFEYKRFLRVRELPQVIYRQLQLYRSDGPASQRSSRIRYLYLISATAVQISEEWSWLLWMKTGFVALKQKTKKPAESGIGVIFNLDKSIKFILRIIRIQVQCTRIRILREINQKTDRPPYEYQVSD